MRSLWCRWRDSNSHREWLPDTVLSRARLPIPPHLQEAALTGKVNALVSEAGLEPARLPIRPSNVRVCQFRHSDESSSTTLIDELVTPWGFEPQFAP
jgi:hypothetical protein